MLDSVIDAARQPFLDLAADIHGSLVYLDAGAAEVVELTLGPAFLLGLGALNVCTLEQSHPDDGLLPLLSMGGQPVQSLLVFTTQLLPETHQHILQLLMVHPHVRRCQLFCSVSELAHAQLSTDVCDLGVEAYSEYVTELRQALAARRAAAGMPMPREDLLQLSVHHLPMHITALDTHTFVLPAASAAASKAVVAGRPAGFGPTDSLGDDEGDEGALGASSALSLLPHALADLSRVLGAKLEPFAIGPASTAIAKELATLPQAGRSGLVSGPDSNTDSPRVADAGAGAGGGSGGQSGSIGLVLVDRSLDLASPCMHGEHVLDLILSCLHRRAAAPPTVPPSGAVTLRPIDVRLDVGQLVPLHPLPPPPPATPPLQHPPSTAAAATSMPSSSSAQGGAAAQDTPGSAAEDTAERSAAATSRRSSSNGGGGDNAGGDGVMSSSPVLWPGVMGLNLFHPEDKRWLGWLSQLWPRPHKDVLLNLRKWLKEALRAEKITPGRSRLTTVVSDAELRNLAGCLMAQPDVVVRHQPIIGLALAAAAALSTDTPPHGPPAPASLWQRLSAYERQLLLALPDGSQGREMLMAMLLEVVTAAHPDKQQLQLSGVLELLVVTYSLSGDRTPPATPLYSGDEAQLREALADVILASACAVTAAPGQQQRQAALAALAEQLQCLPPVQQLVVQVLQSPDQLSSDPGGVRDALCKVLVDVWQRLRWAAATRGKLRDVRRLMEVELDTGAASSTNPLLRQVLSKILLQAENRDLKQIESASLVAGLLTKGLGRLGFGGIAAPTRRVRIEDYSTVLLFVVGGISPAEVRSVRQELDQHVYGHKPKVLVGGTTLLSPGETARLFFT